MKIVEFFKHFPDEAACKSAFKTNRDREGVTCKKCNGTDHYWLSTRSQYKCKRCDFRTTLNSGTMLQHTKLTYSDWFLAMHLLTCTKKGFSTLELQKQLQTSRYQTVLYLVKKIRKAMGLRDSLYMLTGEVEVDEAMIEVAYPKGNDAGRGRGAHGKAKILVMAATKSEPDSTMRIKKSCSYFKMKVIESFDFVELQSKVTLNVDESATVITDGFASYKGLEAFFHEHIAIVCPPQEASNLLPWVHLVISNVKRKLLDIHHCISEKHLQLYLDEFCYKLNRRYFGLNVFDRILNTCVAIKWNPRCMEV